MSFFVADVGNSRLKWGRCSPERVEQAVSLPLDRPEAWAAQFREWNVPAGAFWLIAAVNPEPLQLLATYLAKRDQQVETTTDYEQLPVTVDVEQPERVGLDRLLDAVGLLAQQDLTYPVIVIDAGSAVTIDLVDAGPIFRGGAILPGLRLMAEALHRYTAKLPLIEICERLPATPGRSTEAAMTSGIHAAVIGAVLYLCRQYVVKQTKASVVLTGGDARVLAPGLGSALDEMGMSLRTWPWLTLEGLRVAALRSPEARG